MATKQQITDTLKRRFADVADRGRLFGQALKVRADMAAIRRRLRTSYTELGEEVYRRLRDGELDGDHRLLTMKERVDGLKIEIKQREVELNKIVHADLRRHHDTGTGVHDTEAGADGQSP